MAKLDMPEATNCGIEMSFLDFCNAPVKIAEENTEINTSVVTEQTEPCENSSDNIYTLDMKCDAIINSINKPKIQDILSMFKCAVSIDSSKNHTGITLWQDGEYKTVGFAINMDFDYKSSYLAEARMRKEFKDKLTELLKDKHWEVCVIEDVYGGKNFDTVRKLLALNCVVDELVLDGVLQIDYIYRLKEPEWMKGLRQIIKFGNKLKPKYECQKILEYLDFDLITECKGKKKQQLLDVFYEDRCDSMGILLGLAMMLSVRTNVKSSSVKLRDIQMYFLEEDADITMSTDDNLRSCELQIEDFPQTTIEDCLLSMVEKYPTDVICILVETDKLGTFGIKNGFNFYEQGYGYLVFYNRKTVKRLNY